MRAEDLPAVAAVTPEAVEIDASVVAMGLGLEAAQIPELIRLGEITSIVRHQGFWDNWRGKLAEALAHQGCHIRLPLLDEASGAV
jgi:hypothetical protein